MTKRLLTKLEFGHCIGLGQTKVGELIRTGEVQVVRIGTAVRIPVEEVDRLVERGSQQPAGPR